MLEEITQFELSAALDAVAADVLLSCGYAHGPVDCLQITKVLGLTVAWDDSQSGRARLVRLHQAASRAPRGSILLKHDPRQERLQWAVAHELGEHHAHQVFDLLGVSSSEPPMGTREKIANWLAGRILLPGGAYLAAARRCDWDLLQLKQVFATASHELIARRMLDFELPIVITLLDHGRITFRRGNSCEAMPPLLPLERRCQLEAHESGQPASGDDGRTRVVAWPIHEPLWKREILRTTWSEMCDIAADFDS